MFFILKIIPKLLSDKEKINAPKIKKYVNPLMITGEFLKDFKKSRLITLIVNNNSNKFSNEENKENKPL